MTYLLHDPAVVFFVGVGFGALVFLVGVAVGRSL